LLALLIGLLAPPLLAGAAEPARVVALADAVAAAERSPAMSTALADERAAAAAVRSAGSFGEAAVSLSSYSVTARESVSASLPLPLERSARVRAARASAAAIGQAGAEALALARRDLRVAWYALAAAEHRSRERAASADRSERLRTAIADSFREGRVPRLDEVRVSAESALAEAERAAAQEAEASASSHLALLMGFSPETRLVTPGGDPARPEPEPALAAFLEQVRRRSPALLRGERERAAAEARLRLARRLRWPRLSLSGGANWNDPTQPGTDAWLGLEVGIPLGGGAAVSLATAERDGEASRVEGERRATLDVAQAAWRGAHAARLRLEAIEEQVLPAAREAADLTALAYREGRVDVFRLLEAERSRSEAALLRADAMEAWGTAHAELLRLAGEEP